MDRSSLRPGIFLGLVLAIAALPLFGCQSALVTAMYLLNGNEVDADFPGLKGKKVAVVCRPLVTLQYCNTSVARDLAEQVTVLLKKNVPKIQVIDQRKVVKWTDENAWEEYREVGKAVKADLVVGIDLESFSIFQGQTLYQGKANATISVYDSEKKWKRVFEKILPQCTYPPSTGVPASERVEAEFRREFVAVLAEKITRYFYSHEPYPDVAQDAAALK